MWLCLMATPSTQSQHKTYEVNLCYNTGDCQQMRVKSANSRSCSICYTLSQEIFDPYLFNYLIFINISGFKQCSFMMYEKFPRFHLRNTPSSLSGFNTWLKIIMPTGILDRNNLRPIMGNGKWVWLFIDHLCDRMT